MWHFLFLAFQWHRANGVLSSYPWPSFCTRSQTSIELLWRKMLRSGYAKTGGEATRETKAPEIRLNG